ncbi:hypothetical protein [Bradyrhizobium iriomotense]|uniref:Transposase n=1 Tax=Bradyrhizobium iriomotense TaxID=441950 RepID=A0ABQ6AW08_9BRAD|nr:hypothetical protein [Bradyrhizobium iriomotense]GLR86397.1 hypothetical protein GCM10007857_31080 [Bradyrhizobium iriomotense]
MRYELADYEWIAIKPMLTGDLPDVSNDFVKSVEPHAGEGRLLCMGLFFKFFVGPRRRKDWETIRRLSVRR